MSADGLGTLFPAGYLFAGLFDDAGGLMLGRHGRSGRVAVVPQIPALITLGSTSLGSMTAFSTSIAQTLPVPNSYYRHQSTCGTSIPF